MASFDSACHQPKRDIPDWPVLIVPAPGGYFASPIEIYFPFENSAYAFRWELIVYFRRQYVYARSTSDPGDPFARMKVYAATMRIMLY